MAALMTASADQINSVPGVGPTIAEAVVGFFAEPRNRSLIERLKQAGLPMTEAGAVAQGGPLSGKSYVLTGTLPTLSRQKAASLIEQAGGHVTGSVSGKTDVLVAGGRGKQAGQGQESGGRGD